MKRIIFALMMLAVTITGNAQTKTVDSVISVVDEYSSDPDFEVITIGKLGIEVAKLFGKLATDSKEEKDVLALFNGIDKMLVVEYEDAELSKRQQFESRLNGVLAAAEKIVEVKEEGNTLYMYGTSTEETIEDIIIYIPEDCALICFLGNINFDKLADLIKATDESI